MNSEYLDLIMHSESTCDRRKKPNNSRYKITEMWEIHHEISRRLALGQSNVEIAEDLGVSKEMVSYTKNSPVVEEKVAIMRGAMDADTLDLGIRIKELAPLALEKVQEALEKGTVNGQELSGTFIVKTAERHLDRAGYAPVKKFIGVTGTLTPADIEEIKNRAKICGVIANAE